jgi:MoaA/NifB/PqqE/SkfB family radical SAM enzyme
LFYFVTNSLHFSDSYFSRTQEIDSEASEPNRLGTRHDFQMVPATHRERGRHGFAMISPQYFYAADNRDIARTLFKAAVHTFTMEISSKCNRRCSYCPNSLTDRISENQLLPWEDIERISDDLAEVAYDGVVSLHNYNEPTLDERLPDIIALLRRKLPKASIGTTSNGDFLNREVLERLVKSGMSYIRISPHIATGQEYSFATVLRRLGDITDRLGLPVSIVTDSGYDRKVQASWTGLAMRIFTDHADYANSGNDRGGSLQMEQKRQRTEPCFQPLRLFYILYNGDISPCCHINPDAPGMAQYVVGNYRDFSSVFEAYASTGMAEWRRSLFGDNLKSGPCATCTDGIASATAAP